MSLTFQVVSLKYQLELCSYVVKVLFSVILVFRISSIYKTLQPF